MIVDGDGPTLLGRNWLQRKWGQIYHIPNLGLQDLLSKYAEIFQEGLGTFKGYEATIEVDPNATPRYATRPKGHPHCPCVKGRQTEHESVWRF